MGFIVGLSCWVRWCKLSRDISSEWEKNQPQTHISIFCLLDSKLHVYIHMRFDGPCNDG